MFYGYVAAALLGGTLTAIFAPCHLWLMPVLWLGWFFGLIVLHAAVTCVIGLVMKPAPKKRGEPLLINFWIRQTLDIIFRVLRCKVKITGQELLPRDRRFLMVANHLSLFDALVWLGRIPEKMIFVSKPENMKLPIAGAYLARAGHIPIDRDNPRNAISAINSASAVLASGSASVGVYPEGTRSRGQGLLPFHNAVFKIAQKAGAPIVVAVTENTDKVFKNIPFRPTNINLKILAVLEPEELVSASTADIGSRVRAYMEQALQQ